MLRIGLTSEANVPKFVIERDIAGVGGLPAEDLQAMARRATEMVADPAAQVEWLYSFVTGDKTYCVYIAPNEEVLRQRNDRAGFPTNLVSRVTAVLGPDGDDRGE